MYSKPANNRMLYLIQRNAHYCIAYANIIIEQYSTY